MNNIMLLLEEIEYGYKDVNNKYHNSIDNNFSDTYKLQSPSETEESKLGVCWDQVEYERYLFIGDSLWILIWLKREQKN